MAGYDQNITVDPKYIESAKDFIRFLQKVGKKYKVSIKYKTIPKGGISVSINGTPSGKIDALFQELVINKGIYYYLCSLKTSQKQLLISKAIIPVWRELLMERFPNPRVRAIRKSVLGKLSDIHHIPGEFVNPYSHEYEIILRKWDLGNINDSQFVKEVDSFLHKYLLIAVSHVPGTYSPPFPELVQQARKVGIGMGEDIVALLNRVHQIRSGDLHRLDTQIEKTELYNLSMSLYQYFYYFEDFGFSQHIKTDKLNGKLYKRIRYGDEDYRDPDGNKLELTWLKMGEPCPDCEAILGQYHCEGCDWEQCGRCRGQRIGCDCQRDFD